MNDSNRNEGIMTGGRTASCASNSNRFSLSKTINFNTGLLNPLDIRDYIQKEQFIKEYD